MRRFEASDGNGASDSRARIRPRAIGPQQVPADGSRTEAADEAALASWVGASLLGILLGLGVAKYAQAWAGSVLHPAAVGGAAVVLASALLSLVAVARYLQWRAFGAALGVLAGAGGAEPVRDNPPGLDSPRHHSLRRLGVPTAAPAVSRARGGVAWRLTLSVTRAGTSWSGVSRRCALGAGYSGGWSACRRMPSSPTSPGGTPHTQQNAPRRRTGDSEGRTTEVLPGTEER